MKILFSCITFSRQILDTVYDVEGNLSRAFASFYAERCTVYDVEGNLSRAFASFYAER